MASDPLALIAQQLPDEPALVEDRPDGSVSILGFGELDRRTNRLANALPDLGIRRGDKVVWCGMNVHPAEIEAALEHHPDVLDVAVFGVPSEEWGESVHAVVVACPGSGLEAGDVVSHAREHLAGWHCLRLIQCPPATRSRARWSSCPRSRAPARARS